MPARTAPRSAGGPRRRWSSGVIDKVKPDYIQIGLQRACRLLQLSYQGGQPGAGVCRRSAADLARRDSRAGRPPVHALFGCLGLQGRGRPSRLGRGQRQWQARRAGHVGVRAVRRYTDDPPTPRTGRRVWRRRRLGRWRLLGPPGWTMGEEAVRQFCEQTGAQTAPRQAGDPHWNEWRDFHREGFRRYVRHYVDALKASHPDFQVISNWAFSDHMPERVSAHVAGLSGDFSPDGQRELGAFRRTVYRGSRRAVGPDVVVVQSQDAEAEAGGATHAGSGPRARHGRRISGLLQAGSGRGGPATWPRWM